MCHHQIKRGPCTMFLNNPVDELWLVHGKYLMIRQLHDEGKIESSLFPWCCFTLPRYYSEVDAESARGVYNLTPRSLLVMLVVVETVKQSPQILKWSPRAKNCPAATRDGAGAQRKFLWLTPCKTYVFSRLRENWNFVSLSAVFDGA